MYVNRLLVWVFIFVTTASFAADTGKPDPWLPVRFLIGDWRGTASGEPGQGAVSRKYEFVLRGQFIRETNTSSYGPRKEGAAGEVHEHLGYLSYDKARKTVVLRQFHVEGFVNQYVMSAANATDKKVTFESERFENFSNDWRGRETYEILGPDEFIETFELAAPGKAFEIYSKTHFKRVKN